MANPAGEFQGLAGECDRTGTEMIAFIEYDGTPQDALRSHAGERMSDGISITTRPVTCRAAWEPP